MPVYEYKAQGESGRRVKDRIEARNEPDLEARLRHMGLELISARLEPVGSHAIGSVTRRDLLAFCFDLEQIVRAGLPLLEGLSDLARAGDHPPVRRMLMSLVEQIEGGKTLAEAMSGFPRVFSPVFVSLVRTGEQSGRMGEILENLGKALRWQDEMIAQTKKLLIYPTVVCVVVLGVSVFLLVYLVPQVVTLLQTMGSDLPIQTRVLISLSDFVIRFWWLCLLLPLALAAGIAAVVKTHPSARHRLDLWTLRMPIVGSILRKLIVARFASSLALMYRSGITILDALRSSEEIVGNAAVAHGVRRAAEEIRSGRRLSEGFAALDLFPPLVIRMLRMGESTGALDAALMNVNYFYERDVRESVDRALKLIEPMLTLVLGAMLAFILFAVLTPVYEVLGRVRF
jgi:type IV pilus assembly protein PilC